MWRKASCARKPPQRPCEALSSATGLAAKGWWGRREIQSIAFFRTPGIEWLYSGVTMIKPSAARMASAARVTTGGMPSACTSAS